MRKRTLGRARTGSSVFVSIEKTNRKLKSLQSSGLLGKYASKELINALKDNPNVIINKSKKNQIIKLKTSNISQAQARYIQKSLKKFIQNKTSTPLGITDVRRRSRETLKETLTQLTDDVISDSDLDDFYDLVVEDDYKYFADKVPDSLEIFILINEARDKHLTEEGFIDLLKKYMTINSEDARQRASRLYNKWVV